MIVVEQTRKKRKTVERPATAAACWSGSSGRGMSSAQEAAHVQSELENFERAHSALQQNRVETNCSKFRSGARNTMQRMHMRKMRRAFARSSK